MVVLTALGMLFAGAAVLLVERARIDQSLAQEIEEFRALVAQGIDPVTGRRFATVDRLMFVALERNVPDRYEAMFGLVNGRVRYFSQSENADRLHDDPRFLRGVSAVLERGAPAYGDLDSPDRVVRFAVLPIDHDRAGDRQNDQRTGVQTDGWVVTHEVGRVKAEFNDVIHTYALVAAVGLVLVGAVAWFAAGRLLRPVRHVRRAAQQISETDLTQRIEVTGDDDVSELARTFNAMLDRLKAAFITQQQFLDDAGHELRTPITIVRGHLELLNDDDAAEVADTKAIVLDELDRMNRLVGDLTTLAKADRPDFIQPRPVQVGILVDEILDKARPLGTRTWQIDARADVVVFLDAQRLTQALLQLATNAVKQTVGIDTIAFGSSIDISAGTIRLWVRDTGPGVHPEDTERIFHRFQRGAGSRRFEGSGLGLSIVAAITQAHGGRVDLASSPGHGATFTLVLPMIAAPDPTDDPTDDPAQVLHL
ncbi:sensor histidine kinase [Tenggerimyces flavus]|uniref:histidine kinase n=1 Tax=Tenggerimyces flavus TaxID=1708749 RepID=A0ABV7Y6T1_9ACTN|nr:HAMP domain-containing sensor histidine kinase [Tenggerimyces flavus]MBM7790096.1 signal transduction histidine kinase [Tenggerimyces flavus]